MPASTVASSSRLLRLWPERNLSTYGNAARMPPASGWYSGFPFSGLTQTTAYAARASRAISRPTSSGILPLPAVRDDDDDGAARQRPPAVDVVELLQRGADPRAAPPVGDRLRALLERRLGIARAELGRQPRQPRAERERLHAGPGADGRVQEQDERAGVGVHRAGHVAEHDELARHDLAGAVGPVDGVAAGAERVADQPRMSSRSPRGSAAAAARGAQRPVPGDRRRSAASRAGTRPASSRRSPSRAAAHGRRRRARAGRRSVLVRLARGRLGQALAESSPARRGLCTVRTGGSTGARRNQALKARSKSSSSSWRETSVCRSAK